MISIKSKEEISAMRRAGQVLSKTLDYIEGSIRPGVTTLQLDEKAKEFVVKSGCVPAFKGYKGFPGNICSSINDVVVHGIPKNETLNNGDIISIDMGVQFNGFYADAARTYKVGSISKAGQRLLDVTKDALHIGIREARADRHLSNISHAVQSYVESQGFSVVRALVGHGIGSRIHEDPEIPNFGEPNRGPILKPGMTLAIEPMVNEGTHEVEIRDDGWTVVTKDGLLSAHFEHTVLVTEDEPEILTQCQRKNR